MLGKGLGFVVNVIRIFLSFIFSNLIVRVWLYVIGNLMFRYLSEFKDFVEELCFQVMRLYIEEQGNLQVFKFVFFVEEYLKFLVVSKMVYEMMEVIVINFFYFVCELNFIMFLIGCVFCLVFWIQQQKIM